MLPAAVKKIWFVGSDLQICYHIYWHVCANIARVIFVQWIWERWLQAGQ